MVAHCPELLFSQFRRSEPSLVFKSTFRVASSISTIRAIITSSFGIQSHRYHFSVLAFRAIITVAFSVSVIRAITISSLMFRAIIAFQFWRSEPSLLFSFGAQSLHYFQFSIQSLHHFSVWRSEPSSLFSFGVQSHHHFSVLAFRAITIFSLAFRAIIAFQFWRSKPSPLFSFGVQSHHYHFQFDVHSHIHQYQHSEPSSLLSLMFRVTLPVLAFRAIITSVWRLQPSSLFSFGVQSHHYFQFGVQSHHRFSVSVIRAITTSPFGIQSHRYHSSV
uniref:Uncharacterized protein n=1 Tax=Vitis vinifera TaxID=29760 RepID=F6I6Q8_VITVI